MNNMPQAKLPGAVAWIVCIVAAFYFFYEFMQVTMFNAINPSLMQAFSVHAQGLGDIAVYYFYANVLALLPAGAILDRVSTKKLIMCAMVASIVCTYFFAQAHAVSTLKVCRFITGIAGAFAFLSCLRLASRWFAPRQMALVVGVIVTIAMTGAMMAQAPLTYLVNVLGWRHALTYDALLGVILLFFIVGFVRDYPPGFDREAERERRLLNRLGVFASIKGVLVNRQNWLAGLYTSFLNLPVFILGSMWGALYLTQACHLHTLQAADVNTLFFLGLIIGSPLVGRWSDAIRNRRHPMAIAAVGMLVTMLVIFYLPLTYIGLLICFFLLGAFSSGQVLGYPVIAESNDLAVTGTAEGFASILIMMGGFGEQLTGKLLNVGHHFQVIKHIAYYTRFAYLQAFMVLPIVFVLALGCVYWLRETHARAMHKVV